MDKQKIIASGIVFILAFILYANTIPNKYALDDFLVIAANKFTQKGMGGIKDIVVNDTFKGFLEDKADKKNRLVGGRYRPLSLVTFAVEYEFLGPNPHFSHFINVLLYALTGVLIYLILSRLLVDYTSRKWYFAVPFLTAIIFVAHPIHTEVVANIKGRDEILALLGALLALWFTFDYLEKKKARYLLYSSTAFFLGLLSKENAIMFVVIIPLTIYCFTKYCLKRNLGSVIPLFLTTAVFLIIRQGITGNISEGSPKDLFNNPFLEASLSEKYATISYVLGVYLKLLFYPHPLTYDYYPYQIPIIGWADLRSIGSLIVYLALGIYAIVELRKKNIISYGILFYLITLSIVSNIFFPVGTFMNERFIYVSSIGFCLIVAYLISEKLPLLIKGKKLVSIMSGVIIFTTLLLYSVKTISRNPAWKDHFTLISTDVETSTNSARGNHDAGGEWSKRAELINDKVKRNEYYSLAMKYLTRAYEIYPGDYRILLSLSDAQLGYNSDYDKAISYLEKAIKLAPKNNKAYYNLGTLYLKDKKDLDKATTYLEKAVILNPNNANAINNLGTIYYMRGDYNKAMQIFEDAVKQEPDNPQYCKNLDLAREQLGKKIQKH